MTFKILQYTCFNWTCYTCSSVQWEWNMSLWNKSFDFQYAIFQIMTVHLHFGLSWSCDIPGMYNNGGNKNSREAFIQIKNHPTWFSSSWDIIIGNCFYFKVSFHRHPLWGMQQSNFFLKATLSVANFSKFKNMDFVLSDFWISISYHLLFAVSSLVLVFLVYAWLVLKLQQGICELGFGWVGEEGDLSIIISSSWLWCSRPCSV